MMFSAKEYLHTASEVRRKITVEKKSRYMEFKEKFLREFNTEAKLAACLLKNEFEVKYKCREDMEPYINIFCEEISDQYEKVEMYYDDEESDSDEDERGHVRDRKKSKGYFGLIFMVIDEDKASKSEDLKRNRIENMV